MQTCHEAGVNWNNIIVALTFADMIRAPRAERNAVGFDHTRYFQDKVDEWEKTLKQALQENVRVQPSMIDNLLVRPTTDDRGSLLPGNCEWFTQLWLGVLEVLVPKDYHAFLKIHETSITFGGRGDSRTISLTGKFWDRFWWIASAKGMFLSTLNRMKAKMRKDVVHEGR